MISMSNSLHKIGIMNGRLSEPIGEKIQEFPKATWKQEFLKASNCGFHSIEWIFDTYEKNPIMSKDGIKEIKLHSEKFNVKINSILADFFMKKKLVNISEIELEKNLDILKNLIINSNALEAKILEIPFVDSSSLKTEIELSEAKKNLEKILPLLDEYDIYLTLETDLSPKKFRNFLNSFNHPRIKANYDVGNSAGLGYDLKEEFDYLGDFIYNIHIKDKKLSSNTVPLGTGDVNFELFFTLLKQNNYSGDLIIQGAREINIDCENTATKYLKFVKELVDKYLSNDSDNL